MSTTIKKLYLCLIGMIAGLASWPFAEASIYFQSYFPSYLIFSIFLGLIFGLIMGLFFSSSEGIIQHDAGKVMKGMVAGALFGIIGGVLGFLIGQTVLFLIGDKFIHSKINFDLIGLPISRAIGWAILGIFIGITDGVRAGSSKKIKIGLIGGLLGGLLGGLALEYSRFLIPDFLFARLIGLLIFGLFIGLFYGFIEKQLSMGVLYLLNGKYKGKEYLVNQGRIKIGSSKKNDITLNEYEQIDDNHAKLYIKKDELFIKNLSQKNPVKVNDDIINEHKLKLEDVIKIGEAKFLYKYK